MLHYYYYIVHRISHVRNSRDLASQSPTVDCTSTATGLRMRRQSLGVVAWMANPVPPAMGMRKPEGALVLNCVKGSEIYDGSPKCRSWSKKHIGRSGGCAYSLGKKTLMV